MPETLRFAYYDVLLLRPAIIGRAIDRQGARRAGGTVSWSNRVTNVAEARRVFGRWADQLRSFLEEHYVE